jgi:uncharacterized membrane protein
MTTTSGAGESAALPARLPSHVPSGLLWWELRSKAARLFRWARHSLWLRPVLAAIAGGALGAWLVLSPENYHPLMPGLAWRSTAESARTMLYTVLAATITALGIGLSITMLAVQNAGVQYSPRLLRLYLDDPATRFSLPVFVGTGMFCLVAAQAMGFARIQAVAPRPVLSAAMLLLAVSGAALLYLIVHTWQMVRIENLVVVVRRNTLRAAGRWAELDPRQSAAAPLTSDDRDGWAVAAVRPGFVTAIDRRALLALAERRRVRVDVGVCVGEPVVAGVPLARVFFPEAGAHHDGQQLLLARVRSTIDVGDWRLMDEDPALGVRQLVDIAVKALSPAVSDPFSAIEAVDQLTVVLCELADRPLGPRVLRDGTACPRVYLPGWELPEYLEQGTDEIVRHAVSESSVILRVLHLAGRVGEKARSERDREACREVVRRTVRIVQAAAVPTSPIGEIEEQAEQTLAHLQGRAPLPPLRPVEY